METLIVVRWRDGVDLDGLKDQWHAEVMERVSPDAEWAVVHESNRPFWPCERLTCFYADEDDKVEALLKTYWPAAEVEFRP